MGTESEESQRFAERLFARYPEWRAVASSDNTGGLVVNVPSPTGDPGRALSFWMEHGEPSVAFGGWHTHAGLWDSPEEFLEFVADVLADRKLFLAVDGAAPWWPCVDEPVDDEVADVLTGPDAPPELRVISWSGAKDRTVRLADLSR